MIVWEPTRIYYLEIGVRLLSIFASLPVITSDGIINSETRECFIAIDSLGISTVNLKVLFWIKSMEYRRRTTEAISNIISYVKTVVLNIGLNMLANITVIKLYGSQTSAPVTVA